jgi:drug/metabolite transporter (DMT)-like permease
MDLRAWSLMALLGVLSAGYMVGVARAYQIASPSVIATFDYAYLVSAALWGLVFFAEKPDLLTMGGMILITLAGLLVAVRARRQAPAEEAAAA